MALCSGALAETEGKEFGGTKKVIRRVRSVRWAGRSSDGQKSGRECATICTLMSRPEQFMYCTEDDSHFPATNLLGKWRAWNHWKVELRPHVHVHPI